MGTIAKPVALLFLACALARAQHQHQPAPSQTAKPVPGLGPHQHPVSTANPEAQRFFNQGLGLIYAFNHEAAALAFERAATLDPALGIAWWGYALAVGPNYNEPAIDPARMKAAVDAVQKANALAASASQPERAYIDALSTRFTLAPNPDAKQLATAYGNAMRSVYQRFPDDPDAAVLYADSLTRARLRRHPLEPHRRPRCGRPPQVGCHERARHAGRPLAPRLPHQVHDRHARGDDGREG